MPRFKWLSAAPALLLFAAAAPQAEAPPEAPKGPGCIDVGTAVEFIPSTGSLKVPVTAEEGTRYRILEGAVEINSKFKADEVERLAFDRDLDMPSQSRLVTEFRCFGTWRRQHDFYVKVVRQHPCALIRHRAIQLLEGDVCHEATITALIEEYRKSIYQQIQELILKKIGASRDKRVARLLDEAAVGKSKVLSKAAVEGKAYGDAHPCERQDLGAAPDYGLLEVRSACEERGGAAAGGGKAVAPGAGAADGQDAGKVEEVRFGK